MRLSSNQSHPGNNSFENSSSIMNFDTEVWDIGNNFNGFLVKPKDSESLAKSIERLIFDERLMKKFGANSRKLVQQRFSADIVFKNFLGVYREVLKKDP